jgi:hypothetical protein
MTTVNLTLAASLVVTAGIAIAFKIERDDWRALAIAEDAEAIRFAARSDLALEETRRLLQQCSDLYVNGTGAKQ